LRSLPAGFYGMLLAPGDSFTLGDHAFRLVALGRVQGPNYEATRGQVEVSTPGGDSFTLRPEKRIYASSGSVMTEAAIDSGLTRDVYVSLGEPLPDGRWTVKAWIKPFVDWIWAGCFMMAIGGFVALSDRRYRIARRQATRAAALASGA
jgi:cytochrome c-type biogenesis protein CcmF